MTVTELLDGVWLHTSKRAATTTTVLALGERGCMVVDPAMEPSDLVEVAALVREVGRTVKLGWSTHPHWDHVLWSSPLGTEVVRFATRRNAEMCAAEQAELEAYLEKECPGHETELCGRLTPLEDGDERWPTSCRVIAHEAHAPGHGALWVQDRGSSSPGTWCRISKSRRWISSPRTRSATTKRPSTVTSRSPGRSSASFPATACRVTGPSCDADWPPIGVTSQISSPGGLPLTMGVAPNRGWWLSTSCRSLGVPTTAAPCPKPGRSASSVPVDQALYTVEDPLDPKQGLLVLTYVGAAVPGGPVKARVTVLVDQFALQGPQVPWRDRWLPHLVALVGVDLSIETGSVLARQGPRRSSPQHGRRRANGRAARGRRGNLG